MGQLVNITDITSAVAGTLGVDALTGWTRVIAPAAELPEGSVSSAYLCQTDAAVAGVVRLDAAAAVFAGGNTTHRVSFMVRLVKTDNEIGTAPSTATLLTVTDDTGSNVYAARWRLAYTAPSAANPDLSRYTQYIGGVCSYVDSTIGFYGTEGSFNHTESGGTFRSAAGSATSPSGGVFAPNFPIGQWVRVSFIFDKGNKRVYLLVNGFMTGFYSMNDAAATATTAWTVTFPAWAGFRFHLCEMSSWGDTDTLNDTGLTARTDERNWRTWSVSPTWGQVAARLVTPQVILPTGTNVTLSFLPYSLVTGNRPLRERARISVTAAATGTQTVAVGNLPIEWDENGYFNVVMNLRLGSATAGSVGESWTFTGQFGGLFPSFNIAYSGGAYRMTDAVGNLLGTWAVNEQIQWVLTLTRSGQCFSTIVNQSKDTTATTPFSSPVTLAPSDGVPTTTFAFIGLFTGIGDGVTAAMAEFEAFEGYRIMAFALADSYEEAALSGTAAFTVSTFATAYRATLNRSSLLNISDGSADCNPHGYMTYPQGSQFPRMAISGAWGRSGKKFSDWATQNVPNLKFLRGACAVVVGGFANDLAIATDATTAQTAATNIKNAFLSTARMMLDQMGKFIWYRPTFPYYRPNSSYPASPFAGQYPYVAFHLAMDQVSAALVSLQRTHPRGSNLVIADVGSVDFDDGVHWGGAGTLPAFVNAGPQVAAALGMSFTEASADADSPSQANVQAGARRIFIPFPT